MTAQRRPVFAALIGVLLLQASVTLVYTFAGPFAIRGAADVAHRFQTLPDALVIAALATSLHGALLGIIMDFFQSARSRRVSERRLLVEAAILSGILGASSAYVDGAGLLLAYSSETLRLGAAGALAGISITWVLRKTIRQTSRVH